MASLCANTAQINNYFAAARNQFALPIYQKLFRKNPFMGIIPRSLYDYQDGLQPTALTSTAELPTSYPDSLSTVSALSNGSSTSCDVTTTIVNDGNVQRTYELEQAAFQSRTLCLTDLQFDFQAVQQAKNLSNALAEYSTVFQSDWMRIKNICMTNTKVSTGSADAMDFSSDSNCNFTGVDAPVGYLSWKQLNALYDIQIRNGLDSERAVGMSEGQPLAALVVGPGIKRRLFQYDNLTRDTVNWGDAFQNFVARGINTSINGYVPIVDDFPIRYTAGMVKIYPTINAAATSGRKNIPNPDYRTVANGGLAVYENVKVIMKDIWEVKVRPSDPTQFGNMSFDQRSWTGNVYWVNNKDMCDNIDGNKGFYRWLWSAAAKPIFPDLGVEIITLAEDAI